MSVCTVLVTVGQLANLTWTAPNVSYKMVINTGSYDRAIDANLPLQNKKV